MKIPVFGFAVALLAVGIGAAGGGYWLAQRQAEHGALPSAAPTDERKVLYWYDPMRPEQRFDKPGKSPFMDMELVPKYAGSEQDPSVLSVPAQVVQNLGMRTSTVIRGVLPSDIEVVGSLAYNQREVGSPQRQTAGGANPHHTYRRRAPSLAGTRRDDRGGGSGPGQDQRAVHGLARCGDTRSNGWNGSGWG